MKILHVTKKYPSALGGDAIVVASLEQEQTNNGHQVSILTSNCDEIQDRDYIYKFGIKDSAERLDTINVRRILSLIALSLKAFTVLRKIKPDIIHTHSVDLAFFVSLAAKVYNIPVVHTFHIITYYDPQQSVLRRKTEILLAKSAQPQIITAPNVFDAQKLREAGLKQTITVPNGLHVSNWRTDLSIQKYDIYTFVILGRLEDQKGIEYLIRAAAQLRNKAPRDFRVLVIGTGSRQSQLESLSKELGVADIFLFMGRKTQTEVKNILNASHCAVISSLYETTPLSLLEAWAVGIPVITTKVGIINDLKNPDKYTRLIKSNDTSSLFEAMQSAMTDDVHSKQMSKNAKVLIAQYDWPKVSKLLQAVYNDAVGVNI